MRRCMCSQEKQNKNIKETESGGIRMDMCARKKTCFVLVGSVKHVIAMFESAAGPERESPMDRASERARKRERV
jgi:hypothetical protein